MKICPNTPYLERCQTNTPALKSKLWPVGMMRLLTSKRPGVRFGRGRGRGREQNTFPGAGAGGVAGNYRPGSPYLAGAGAGNGDKPSPGAGNSRRRESRSFPAPNTPALTSKLWPVGMIRLLKMEIYSFFGVDVKPLNESKHRIITRDQPVSWPQPGYGRDISFFGGDVKTFNESKHRIITRDQPGSRPQPGYGWDLLFLPGQAPVNLFLKFWPG